MSNLCTGSTITPPQLIVKNCNSDKLSYDSSFIEYWYMEISSPFDGRYESRVVAFVDILGFRALVHEADKDSNLRSLVIEALRSIEQSVPNIESSSDLKAQHFSDSLILSALSDFHGIFSVSTALNILTWKLLRIGILIRGGITVGPMYQDSGVVFGIGVNHAYYLESNIARVPRIVVSAKVIDVLVQEMGEDWKGFERKFLKRDKDGVWYINFLEKVSHANYKSPSETSVTEKGILIEGKKIRDLIQEKVDKTMEQPDVFQKVHWLANFWNEEVCNNQSQAPFSGLVLSPVELPGQSAENYV